jgi:hypothetical protein
LLSLDAFFGRGLIGRLCRYVLGIRCCGLWENAFGSSWEIRLGASGMDMVGSVSFRDAYRILDKVAIRGKLWLSFVASRIAIPSLSARI